MRARACVRACALALWLQRMCGRGCAGANWVVVFTFDLFNQLGNGSGGFSHSRLSSFFFQFVESARSEQDDVTQRGPAPRWQR